jgi:hypothetical protein
MRIRRASETDEHALVEPQRRASVLRTAASLRTGSQASGLAARSGEEPERGIQGEPLPLPVPSPASVAGQSFCGALAPQLLAAITVPFLKCFVVEHDSSSSTTSMGMRVIRRV